MSSKKARLVLGSGIVAAALMGPSSGAQEVRSVAVVTAAGQVTADPNPARSHSSPQIARDPRTGTLAIVESDPRSATRSCIVHISTTGGATWVPGGNLMLKPYTDCAFYGEYGPMASVAFGRDGTLYVAFIASEMLNRARDETPRPYFLARSTDGGRTFSTAKVTTPPTATPTSA